MLYLPAMRLRKVTLMQADYLFCGAVTLYVLSELLPRFQNWFFVPAIAVFIWACLSMRAQGRREQHKHTE